MKTVRWVAASVTLLCFVVLAHSRCPVWEQSFSRLNLDANRILWSDLSFRAKRAVVDVAIDIRLAPFPPAEFETIWRASPQSIPLPPAAQEVYNLEVHRVIDHIFSRPVSLWNQVLFDPSQANALYRVRSRRGQDDIERAYWFSGTGVHRLRKMPKTKGEVSLEPQEWTDVKTSFYAYDLTRQECPQVIDPMLVIYLVSTAPIERERGVLSLCVFGKQELHRVRLRYQGLENLKVDYFLMSGKGKVQKKGKVDGLRIALESEPMVSEENGENFSFLGMQGDIAIHIDPQLRIPLQVSGKIPTVGAVTLKLSEVKMKAQ